MDAPHCIATVTLNPALDIATATDQVVPAHKLRCAAPRYDPGGGGINVARVIHTLGGEATAVFPSGHATGMALVSMLEEEGVPVRAIPVAGATRISMTVAERTSGAEFRFVLPGPTLNETERQAVLDTIRALAGRGGYIVASGSLPPGVPADFHARIARVVHAAGARAIVDTSGPALAACAGCGAYLMKPSLRELEELCGPLGDDAAIVAAARDLIARDFAEMLLVSRAERGAMLVTRDDATPFAPIPVTPVSAVGAGDSMVAAVTLALSRGASPHEAARHGIAAGTAALMTPGTELVRPADYARLLKQARESAL